MEEYQCKQCGTGSVDEQFCWQCKEKNDRDACLALSSREVQRKIDEIILNIENDDYANNEFMELFCYRNINTHSIAEAAFENNIFYPAELYYDASPELRDKMIKLLLETRDACLASRLLYCLAMQGDDEVLKTFVKLEKKPRAWRQKLMFNPFVYARLGGWSFDQEGKRLELVFSQSYRMIEGDKSLDKAARIGQLRKNKCPNCECQLMDILTIDGRDERLQFLGIDGVIKAVTCPNCVIYEPLYCKYKVDGDSKILPFACYTDDNFLTEEQLQTFESNPFVLAKEAVNPFFGCCSEDMNIIGGMPHWVQETEYHSCPSCQKKMRFFAQINLDTMRNGLQGSLFLQICTDCKTICVVHQQE